MNKKYLVVSGPLASGKTSLTRLVADSFGWQALYEDLNANPYFKDYYQDNKKWAFHTVISFMLRGIELKEEIEGHLKNKSVIQDWYFGEHHEIYGNHVYQEGIVAERDHQIFVRLNKILMDNSIQPTFLIYLEISAKEILKRISSRKRDGEVGQVMQLYVENLVRVYEQWIKTIQFPVLKINSEQIDYVNNEQGKKDVIKIIDLFMKNL